MAPGINTVSEALRTIRSYGLKAEYSGGEFTVATADDEAMGSALDIESAMELAQSLIQ